MKISMVASLATLAVSLYAQELLYPVGKVSMPEMEGLLLLYQKSVHHTELLLWNPITHLGQKLLLSSYNPAGIAMLPDDAGFSFIDNGRIRIKRWKKRSPKTIEFDRPLYDFTIINWLSNDLCYFSAREQRRFGIYISDDDGNCLCMAHDEQADYMYPQVIDTTLYCIKRTVAGQHWLISMHLPKDLSDSIRMEAFADPARRDANKTTYEVCMQLNDYEAGDLQSYAFLQMTSASEGFLVSHPAELSWSDKILHCNYISLKKRAQNWTQSNLFDFFVPLYYLLNSSDDRLFESIMPLLPKKAGDTGFFFVSLDRDEATPHTMSLFHYSMNADTNERISLLVKGMDCMQPYIDNAEKRVYYGGALYKDDSVYNDDMIAPKMGLDGNYDIECEIPYISIF